MCVMTNSSSTTRLNGERSPLRQPPSNGSGGEQSMRDSEAGDSSRANTSLNNSNNGDSHRRLFGMDHSRGAVFKVGLDLIVLMTGEW